MLAWSRSQVHPPRLAHVQARGRWTLCPLRASSSCQPQPSAPHCPPPSLPASLPVDMLREVWICCGLVQPGLFLLSFFIYLFFLFFENRFEPVIQLIISQSTGLVATAQHEAGDQETGPRKLLSRKSNFIIEKSSVLSSLLRHRHHKFTYSICRCRNAPGPICIMLREGLAPLLNPNAARARKQLLSCRHWQGERPQMDSESKPHSQPRLLITRG